MGNKPFNVIVVLFWLATMSWLTVSKILPPLRVGEPPNYASILQDTADEPPVCWSIRMRDRMVGWAANKVVHRKDGIHELYSRVYLGEVPLEELAPGWLASVLKPLFLDTRYMDIDKRSCFIVDPLGRLAEFDSRVRLGSIEDAIHIHGQIEGALLKLSVQSGELSANLERTLAPSALMSDELSPQARMPGLRVGQTWTVPIYSPFRAPNSPLEILQAIVEREDRFQWEGENVLTRVIVYRGDAGSGIGGGESRGRMWVRDDGVVLRQEVIVFHSPVQFDRLTDSQSKAMQRTLTGDWNLPLPARQARQMLKLLGDQTIEADLTPASPSDDADPDAAMEDIDAAGDDADAAGDGAPDEIQPIDALLESP